MIVDNVTWQLVGGATPTTLVVQNVGAQRIAYVFAASQPAVDAFDLDKDQHFIMNPGEPAISITNMDVELVSMYARVLGSKDGELSVNSWVAP